MYLTVAFSDLSVIFSFSQSPFFWFMANNSVSQELDAFFTSVRTVEILHLEHPLKDKHVIDSYVCYLDIYTAK
jgi:hypothetical protein